MLRHVEDSAVNELPKNPPVNPAAEQEKDWGSKEPTLEQAIDDETGGLLHPSRDDVRSDKTPEDKPKRP